MAGEGVGGEGEWGKGGKGEWGEGEWGRGGAGGVNLFQTAPIVLLEVTWSLGGCTRFMHCRRLKTIRPSHSYNAGAELVGFSPTRQTSRFAKRGWP